MPRGTDSFAAVPTQHNSASWQRRQVAASRSAGEAGVNPKPGSLGRLCPPHLQKPQGFVLSSPKATERGQEFHPAVRDCQPLKGKAPC